MPASLRRLTLSAALVSALLAPPSIAVAKDDEYWGGYWRSFPYFNRSHSIRYRSTTSPYPPALYYGHAPPPDPDDRPEPLLEPHIGSYRPIYGPGRYYGPAIDPYYAPGRDRYGRMRYGWW